MTGVKAPNKDADAYDCPGAYVGDLCRVSPRLSAAERLMLNAWALRCNDPKQRAALETLIRSLRPKLDQH